MYFLIIKNYYKVKVSWIQITQTGGLCIQSYVAKYAKIRKFDRAIRYKVVLYLSQSELNRLLKSL